MYRLEAGRRLTNYAYQVYPEGSATIPWMYSNEHPYQKHSDKSIIVPNSIQVRTPYKDITGIPLYTGYVVKHYNMVDHDDIRTREWAYDLGVIHIDEQTGEFFRTTCYPEIDRFELSDKCQYLFIGHTMMPRSQLAVNLWFTLAPYQKEEYYYGTGIIGFLEEFALYRDDPGLTDQEIEVALDEIERRSIVFHGGDK
jgi:hypothetical protein